MSQFETSAGIERLTGKLNSRERIVMRQKKYRLPSGRIIKMGPKEAYVKERRDYNCSPLTEKEKTQKELWTEICREGSRIVHDENHPRYSELFWSINLKFAAKVRKIFDICKKNLHISKKSSTFARKINKLTYGTTPKRRI